MIEDPADFKLQSDDVRTRDQKASAAATCALYGRFASQVQSFVRGCLLPAGAPLRRIFDADDLVQEAWQKVFQAVHDGYDLSDTERFFQFVYAAARNRYLYHYREYIQTRRRCLLRDEPMLERDFPDNEPDPAELAARAEQSTTFRGRLSKREKVVLQNVTDGLPLSKAAAELGVSVRTAQLVVQQIRQKWDLCEVDAGRH